METDIFDIINCDTGLFFFFRCVSLGKINQNKRGNLQAFIFGDHCSNKHVSGVRLFRDVVGLNIYVA